MNPFSYHRANDSQDAIREISKSPQAKFIGGGTNLIDLMKENVEKPNHLIDVNRLQMNSIQKNADGVSIGALVSNAKAAYDAEIQKNYPLLSDAILAGASPQLRNMATCGGNLLQRTRCYYFYDKATACNKREPGSGCDAIKGYNRIHAVLGASESCIAVHPSDMCVALSALNAKIKVAGPKGERVIAIRDFHRLPGDTPQIDTTLSRDELIMAIDLPSDLLNENYFYLKVRDRSSYAFALVSAAVALKIEGDTITKAQVAMGGVAHKPWRDESAESLLVGEKATENNFRKFAAAFFNGARGFEFNEFKIRLGQRVLVRALNEATHRGNK